MTFVTKARQDIGYIYLTDDSLPDPRDTLSSYFSDPLTLLQ